ncbi:AMP-binding protein, partial [Polynucleobacter sp. MG-28-Ekke-A2]|uniref:AMP-binding protein n=1 Tax=Polynucleobacter sp. MG-28-Ekke-A2 TaxID=3108276 RepID=UPI002B22B405
LDCDWEIIADNPNYNPISITTPENPAYVIYTSGSTGKPKGVVTKHINVVNFIKNQDYILWSYNEITLQIAPLSFDASTFEIWGALLNGCQLVVMSPKQWALNELQNIAEKYDVSLLHLTAPLFNSIPLPNTLSNIEKILTGGDVVSYSQVVAFLNVNTKNTLVHCYGPTETTVFCITYKADDPASLIHPLPIGRPIWNTRIYVLDNSLEPVPAGIAGELYIAGAGLARGYL